MKNLSLIILFLASFESFQLLASNPETTIDKSYTAKKFYFATWGDPGNATEDLKTLWMAKLANAGITDILPGGDAEQLKELIRIGNKYGIRVHAWHWMMNVGGAQECRDHPDWYSVNALGQSCRDYHPYVDYYSFLSPFSPGAREYVKKGVRELAKIKGLASVHFDYIRYVDVVLGADLQKKYKLNGKPLMQDRLLPEFDFDYHPLARKEFKEKFGVDPMDLPDKEENPAWKQFRMNAITSLVEECIQICHQEGTQASAAVFPFPELAREYVRQDWSHWSLDLFFPMAYKKDHQGNVNWVGFATKEGVRDIKPGAILFTGVATDDYGENMADFEEAIKQAHDNGAKGICFFHANALNEKHLNIIKQYDQLYNK